MPLNDKELERYNRQIILPEFGEEAQNKLKKASALIIGVGGLGSVSSVYLAAAGLGRIGLVDDDIVSLSNLQRQVLYREDMLGKSKAIEAKKSLERLNSHSIINAYNYRFNRDNGVELIRDYNIIVDGTDNFETRYLINDLCMGLNKPFVYASIQDYSGQVSVFNLNQNSCNYRDLFHNDEKLANKKDLSKGVIGILPSIIASIQTNEVIKIITGIGEVLDNRLAIFNIKDNQYNILNIKPSNKARETSLREYEKIKTKS